MRQVITLLMAVLLLPVFAQRSEKQGWYVKDYNESSAKAYLDNNYYLDKVEGIWQSTDGYKYAIEKNVENSKRETNRFRVIVLESSVDGWKPSEIKGFIDFGSINEVYSMKYYTKNMYDGSDLSSENVFLVFENPMMMSFQRLNGNKINLYKLYPKINSSQAQQSQYSASKPVEQWSGSCVAIGNRLVATNFHVVEDAQNLVVTGINGDKTTNYTAEVILTDKFNDLAVMKITDYRFSGFNIKYGAKNSVSDIGTDIFVLGYPLTTTMGEDIKLTTGVISSKTGFQGDVSQYQISAAVQPGNSGGPLFDNQGNLVGIVSAKHRGAENVGYAIKLSYLRNLLDSSNEPITMNLTNTISTLSLPEKVKAISPCVLLVKANVGTSSSSLSGQYSGGTQTHQGASTENKARAQALIESAGEKYERQDFSGAYNDACQSVDLYPTPVSHYMKGFLAAYFINDADAAIESLEYCMRENHRPEACSDILASCYAQKDNWEKAISYADKALGYDRKNMQALELRGIGKSQLGRKDDAIADYLQAIKFDGVVEYNFANIYNNLAFEYMKKGELNKAKDYIDKSIKHSHTYGNAWDTYGELNYRLGNYAGCIDCMNKSITIAKLVKQASWIDNSYLYRGLAKKSLGDMAGAYKDLEKAIENGEETAKAELSKIDASAIDFSEDKTYNEMYATPIIRKNGAPHLQIKGVEVCDEYTAIYCQWTNTKYSPSGWYSIDSNAYIRDKASGKKLLLLTTENCSISPNTTSIQINETKSFVLYFPSISKDATEIDFVESDKSEWKFYGIKLKKE